MVNEKIASCAPSLSLHWAAHIKSLCCYCLCVFLSISFVRRAKEVYFVVVVIVVVVVITAHADEDFVFTFRLIGKSVCWRASKGQDANKRVMQTLCKATLLLTHLYMSLHTATHTHTHTCIDTCDSRYEAQQYAAGDVPAVIAW